MRAQWGIWDVTEGKWMHDPLRAPVNMSPALYASRAEAERRADRDWRDLNPDSMLVVREFAESGSGAARERFARGYEEGERDAEAGRVRQLAVTSGGERPPIVKDEDSAYYHGYKAAVGGARSEDGAWAAYVAKHELRANAGLSPEERIEHFKWWYRNTGHWVYPSIEKAMEVWKTRGIEGLPDPPKVLPNPAHLSLDGKFSGGLMNPAHLNLDGTFSLGVGTKDGHMRPNAGESLLDEGESIRSHMPGKTTLSIATLSVGVPRRRRRVYAVRMGIDDRGIAMGGFHWIPASEPEEAERFWLEHTGRHVSLRGGMHQNANGDVIWEDNLLTWRKVGAGIEMIPSAEGQARAREMLEERESVRGRGRGGLDEQADFLETAMGNGWDLVRPEDIGAMTDATIVSQDGFLGETGQWYPHPGVEAPVVYAHMNYAVEDPIERWAEGEPVFWAADVLSMTAEQRARICEEYERATGESYEANARKNVSAVIDAFLAGRRHSEKTCSTDGERVYSYSLPIAARLKNGQVVVLDKARSPSVTTSSQINAVLSAVPSARSVDAIPGEHASNAKRGEFKPPAGLSPAEKFFFESSGYGYKEGATPAQQKRARVEAAKALAAAEAEAEDRGWKVEWEYDQEADTSWMDEEDRGDFESGTTEMLVALLRDENGNVLGSLGGVHLRARGGRDPYGRVVEAELALEALEAERSAGTAMALNRGGRRRAKHAPNRVFRHMDLAEIERILGPEEIARVLSVDQPASHARSHASKWWEADDLNHHDAYTNLGRMLKAGVLDDLVAEARGRR